MGTLYLTTRALPGADALSRAARARRWRVHDLKQRGTSAVHDPAEPVAFYGSSTRESLEHARKLNLHLVSPPLDLLARLPCRFTLRQVRFITWTDLVGWNERLFAKPADPVDKCFDVGIYARRADIRVVRPIPADTPVLLSEPVEWLAEYRCFVAEGRVVATSPYLSFGHALAHHPGTGAQVPAPVLDLAADLAVNCDLPRAFVIDIGLIEDRGWAVVEFNPAWCSGILSADPDRVLDVLGRACQPTSRR
ncbi:MAG TPA: ATP-grasp domain-containing protein [Tepidisphaeraceae bacterium]